MAQKDVEEISPKSTKNQILEAYNKVVNQLKITQIANPVAEKRSMDEKKTVETASSTSSESIVSDLANLKITLTRQIDTLSEGLSGEFEKFKTIQQAVEIEQKHLSELYKIKETAETFSALVLAQKQQEEHFNNEAKERQETFEQEMQKERDSWKASRERLVTEYKNEEELLKKKRTREEEEYTYNLELARRKDDDEYQDKKNKLEKELETRRLEFDERDTALQKREVEFAELKLKVDKFPNELAEAIKKAEQKIANELTAQHKFDLELRDSKITGEHKLYEQKIKSLEAKIVEQEAAIKVLTKKADDSTSQVQFIACRALDASSQRFTSERKSNEPTKESTAQ